MSTNKFNLKLEKFQDNIEKDLAWRKKEIIELLLLSKDIGNNKTILKATILLIYAHWEGYIKNSSNLYLKFVAEQKQKLEDLSSNFKAIALKSQVSRSIKQQEGINLHNEITFLDAYEKKLNGKFRLLKRDSNIVKTKSNLNPKVLENIFKLLGLKYKEAIKDRENYLNIKLLKSRNNISHGNKHDSEDNLISLEFEEINNLKDIIFAILDNFTEELIEFTTSKLFLNCNSAKKELFNIKIEKKLRISLSNINSI